MTDKLRSSTVRGHRERLEKEENLPLLIDTKQACMMLFGDDRRKNFYRLYTMIDRGEIAARKLGDRWYIPRAAMAQFFGDPASPD